ncbi:type II toxin-antitoxin system VapC family toxin [Saccharomonospora halophila]|uniref:type II toxin-antitoxin system VapC family toxin n=1 Tax=Saccharomonospora halophila TaxID=129922 RepID=UPI0009FDD474
MIVVDASAALSALFRNGPARRALGEQQLHVPHLIDAEIASALRRRVAAGQVEAAAAWNALRVWQRLGVMRYATLPLLHRVWELRDNASACDASYVALAEFLDCGLLTADARLARAPGTRCVISVVPH